MLGTALTLTAAFDFRAAHSRVRNVASGALDDDATVTFSEMIEHSFYQGQNLVQARAEPRIHVARIAAASGLSRSAE